ncbi:hypothetical protein [Burkholderia latens]|nr:hypothetical protein [Burkholderia latens]
MTEEKIIVANAPNAPNLALANLPTDDDSMCDAVTSRRMTRMR